MSDKRVNYLAREILQLLEDEGSQSIQHLKARYIEDWSARTFGYAISQLKEADLIERIPNLMDMRQGAYRIKKVKTDGMHSVLRDTEDRQLQSSTD